MEKIILIRIGEIFLKGNNRGYFLSVLKNNVKSALKGYKCKLILSQNRLYVEDYCEDDGEVFCSDCYKDIAGPRCYYCKQVINDTAIQFHNRKYHPHQAKIP